MSKKEVERSIQIEDILRLLEFIWKKHPSLRLCQLIGNCFEPGDHYHKNDDLLEKKLREVYHKGR